MNQNHFDSQKIIKFFLPSFFWLALLAVPLGVSYFFPIASPFVLIKSAWLQILAAFTILVFLLVTGFWRKEQSIFWRSTAWRKAVLPVWIFWLSWSLLSIWSLNPLQSWFGSYLRQTGLLFYFWLSIWYSFLIYYFGGFYCTEKKAAFWKRGVNISAFLMSLVGSLVGLYAFVQFCGYDFAVWQETQLYSRAIGTLGQPNFLGSFLLFTLAMTAYIFFVSRRLRFKFLAFLMFCFQFVGLVVSGSRSAWLAAIIVIGFLILSVIWRRWHWRSLLITPILFFAILTTFYILMPSRFASLLDSNSGSIVLRRSFYRSSIELIQERPMLGTGLENGGEAFVKKYQVDWGALMKVDSYTDKAHNSILDAIIQTGFIGFIFWSGLYLFWAWQCYLLWRKIEGRLFALAASSALSAYSISLLFGISDISSVFYFWVISALVVAGNLSLNKQEVFIRRFFKQPIRWRFLNRIFDIKKPNLQIFLARLGGGFLALLAIGQIYFSLSAIQADYYWLQIYRLLPSGQYFTTSVLWSYLDQSAFNPIARIYYQTSFASYAVADFNNLDDLASKQLVRQELNSIFIQLPERTYDDRVIKARLDCFMAGADKAMPLFNKLVSISPLRPAIYRDYAQCLQESGQTDKALEIYRHSLTLLPSRNDSFLNDDHRAYVDFYNFRLYSAIALIQESRNELKQAADSWQQASFYYPSDMLAWKKRADIYLKQGKYQEALVILEHCQMRQPDVYIWPLAISQAYVLTGDLEHSNVWRQRALILNPNLETSFNE